MIENKRIATTLNEMILSMGAELDQSLWQVKEACPEPEFVAYREFVASLLATMLDGFMNPLHARHPDLKPPQLD